MRLSNCGNQPQRPRARRMVPDRLPIGIPEATHLYRQVLDTLQQFLDVNLLELSGRVTKSADVSFYSSLQEVDQERLRTPNYRVVREITLTWASGAIAGTSICNRPSA